MNKKGQALVEFVLILPVFIFIVLAVVDFGRIFNSKTQLENNSNDIINLYKKGKTLDEIKGIYPENTISVEIDDSYYKISISRSLKLITPGFNRIFGNPYVIEVERFISNE